MRLTDEEVRRITLNAIAELGDKANPETVKQVVSRSVANFESQAGSSSAPSGGTQSAGRVILTSFGLNQSGVVSALTKTLADDNCDIQDLTQKLMGDFFTIMMVIDISDSPKDLKGIQEEMNRISENMNIKVYLQHEDIFRNMHRI